MSKFKLAQIVAGCAVATGTVAGACLIAFAGRTEILESQIEFLTELVNSNNASLTATQRETLSQLGLLKS